MISLFDPTRKKVLLIFGSSLVLSLILIGIIAPSSPKSLHQDNIPPDSQIEGIAATSILSQTPTLTLPAGPVPSGNRAGGPTLSPTILPTSQPSPTQTLVNLEYVTVDRVVDGDTVKLTDGRVVRYIGIDTPETVDPRKPVQCFAKEASQKNKELVEGKLVGMEKDVSEVDKYGRILRYIYLDGVLINELLVKEGYAFSYSYPPDIKYQNLLFETERLARENNLGLWGVTCTTASSDSKISPAVIFHPSNSFTCDCNKSCAKLSCSEAQYQLSVCNCQARDGDGDGIACDSNCQ